MDKFLGKYNLSKLNKQETEILNTLITADEIKAVIRKTHKMQNILTGCCPRRTLLTI